MNEKITVHTEPGRDEGADTTTQKINHDGYNVPADPMDSVSCDSCQ